MPKADSREPAPLCRWRTSAETLDLIEALERIEALLVRMDARLQKQAVIATPALDTTARQP